MPSIRERLAQLAAIDTLRHVSGASRHQYELAPPLSEERVCAWETRHGVTLPDAYRRFVREVSAGGAGPGTGLPLLDEPERAPAQVPLDPHGDRRVLWLADKGCGLLDLLVLDGPERGSVWVDLSVHDEDPKQIATDFLAWYEGWLSGPLERHLALRAAEPMVDEGEGLFELASGYHALGALDDTVRVARRMADVGITSERARFALGVLEEHDPERGAPFAMWLAEHGDEEVQADARATGVRLRWASGEREALLPDLVAWIVSLDEPALDEVSEWIDHAAEHLQAGPLLDMACAGTPAAAVAIGSGLAERGDHAMAVTCFEAAAREWTDSIFLHIELARSLAALDRVPQALAAVERAIALDEESAEEDDEPPSESDVTGPLRAELLERKRGG